LLLPFPNLQHALGSKGVVKVRTPLTELSGMFFTEVENKWVFREKEKKKKKKKNTEYYYRIDG
jgi:hypothetical protein